MGVHLILDYERSSYTSNHAGSRDSRRLSVVPLRQSDLPKCVFKAAKVYNTSNIRVFSELKNEKLLS